MSFRSLHVVQRPTLSWRHGAISPEDMTILTLLSLFGEAHAVGVTLEGEDQRSVEFLNKSYLTRGILPTRLGPDEVRARKEEANTR